MAAARMTESVRIVDQLNRAITGHPWHGTSIGGLLRGVTASRAAARPIRSAHTIWELVRHLTAWTNEVAGRVDGHPAGVPAEGDWPRPSGRGAAAWRRDRAELLKAHRRLVAKVARLSDIDLAKPTIDPRRRSRRGVSRYALLHGLVQHHAYHGGQLAQTKNAVIGNR